MTLLHDAIKRLRPEIDEENVDPESWLLFHQRVGFKQAIERARTTLKETSQ